MEQNSVLTKVKFEIYPLDDTRGGNEELKYSGEGIIKDNEVIVGAPHPVYGFHTVHFFLDNPGNSYCVYNDMDDEDKRQNAMVKNIERHDGFISFEWYENGTNWLFDGEIL